MASSPPSNPTWVGEILIAEFDVEDLEDLERQFEQFIELDEGEQLVVRGPGDDRVEVMVLEDLTEEEGVK